MAAARLISSLPTEIQAEILQKLPVKLILTCKCVCKLWLNLISSPKFINDHLHLSIQNKKNRKIMFTDKETWNGKPLMYSIDCSLISSTPDLSCDYFGNEAVRMDAPFEYKKGMGFRILGACNGLICFSISIDKEITICVWNPATREYKGTQHCDINSRHPSTAGFGYDSKTGDYKLVRIVDDEKPDYCEVEVYTFGSHLSKTIHTYHHKFPTLVAFCGVFLKGSLHWIGNMSKKDTSNSIVSFDISNEKLVDVPLPENSILYLEDSSTRLCKKLGVLGDCLSLVLVDVELFRAEVWVMHDYGVRESWIKLITTTQKPITHYLFWTPMLSLINGEILMYTYDGFVLCDPKNERVGKVSSFFQKNTFAVRIDAMIKTHPESYVESLVSLNSGAYVKKPKGSPRNVE